MSSVALFENGTPDEPGAALAAYRRAMGALAAEATLRWHVDPGNLGLLSRAVREVFVRLYDDGLIYRALAMINWCPFCRTAISDVEVEFRDVHGKIYRAGQLPLPI